MRAMEMARERNLDLVEISPQAIPPVCKLMDYGRFKYEQAKRENEARKRQKISEVKEIRLHAHTDQHDINVKVKKILQFLEDGDKVKVSVQFRGREVFHPEIGRKLLETIMGQLKNLIVVERSPIQEGRNMWVMMTRVSNWESAKKAYDAAVPSEETPQVQMQVPPQAQAEPVAAAPDASPPA